MVYAVLIFNHILTCFFCVAGGGLVWFVGAMALAATLKAKTKMKTLSIGQNDIGPEGTRVGMGSRVRAGCGRLGGVARLFMGRRYFHRFAPRALFASLASLPIYVVNIFFTGAKAIATALVDAKELIEFMVDSNRLGTEGGSWGGVGWGRGEGLGGGVFVDRRSYFRGSGGFLYGRTS